MTLKVSILEFCVCVCVCSHIQVVLIVLLILYLKLPQIFFFRFLFLYIAVIKVTQPEFFICSMVVWYCCVLSKVVKEFLFSLMIYLYVLSHFRHVQLFATLWTVAHQAPLAMGFSRQEYWSGLPCPPSGDLPDPGIEPASLMSPTLAGGFLPLAPPGKP